MARYVIQDKLTGNYVFSFEEKYESVSYTSDKAIAARFPLRSFASNMIEDFDLEGHELVQVRD